MESNKAQPTAYSQLYHPTFSPDWDGHCLYDLAEWINGIVFKSTHFAITGMPVLKIAEIKNGITAQTKFTQSKFEKHYFVSDGNMLFSWSGQPETSIDTYWWHGPNGWLNQHIFKIEVGNMTDRVFFYYILKYLKPNFIGIAKNKQTTGLGHVTKKDLKEIRVSIPPLSEQKAIARVLGAIDNKIELNRRMNATLEGIAQALFKSWFVDFDPVIDKALAAGNPIPEPLHKRAEVRRALGEKRKPLPVAIEQQFPNRFVFSDEMGWMPDGWETQPLYEIAKFVNGAAFKSEHFCDDPKALPVVKIAEIKHGLTGQTKYTMREMDEKYLINNGEILLSWSGNPNTSIDTFIWTNGPGVLNQHIFRVDLKNERDRYLVYYQLKVLRPVFAKIAQDKQTTGLGHFTAGDMKQMCVLLPTATLINGYNTQVSAVFGRWYRNLIGSQDLAKLRDTLLPKLLSGQLRIPDAEKLIAETKSTVENPEKEATQ